MKTTTALFLGVGIIGLASAQDIENDDIPTQCAVVCSNIVAVSADCDRAFERDSDELACMCQAEGAEQVVPICAACIEFYDSDNDDNNDNNDDDDNDAGDIRRSCGFSSTTYDPSTTYSQAAMTAATSLSSTSSGAGATATSNQASASSRLSELSSSAATATGAAATSVSSVISSVSSQAAQPTNTGNAAPSQAGSQAALAGAALLAAAAWL